MKTGRKAVTVDAVDADVVYMSSTAARKGFGRMLDTVADGRTVLIMRHHVPHAVVISADRYEALAPTGPDLDALTAEFDELLARMQMPDVQTAIREALRVSPDEMGQAALTAAQRI